MDKSVLRSLILLTFTMLMACQGGNSNPPSSKAVPKETAKQTETVRDITLYLYHDFPKHKAKMLADILEKVHLSNYLIPPTGNTISILRA